MLGFAVLCLTLHLASAAYDCPQHGPYLDSCPVRKTIDGEVHCFAMILSDFGTAYTYGKGDQSCRTKFGPNAHLANIYDQENFEKTRCYMIEVADVQGQRDPKVLTGMTYDTDSGITKLYNGNEVQTYWGSRGKPLSYGNQMVIRAHPQLERSLLVNLGTTTTRYERVLCEFPLRK